MLKKIFNDFSSDIEVINKKIYSLMYSRMARALLCIRICCRLQKGFLRLIASMYLRSLFIEIGYNVKIGLRLRIPHPNNIIIASGAEIGNNTQINQYVTIGGNFNKKRIINGQEKKFPIIGNSVVIASGAVIGGPVIVGNSSIIGSNATVTKDIPSNSIAYGQNKLSSKKIEVLPKEGTYRVIDN